MLSSHVCHARSHDPVLIVHGGVVVGSSGLRFQFAMVIVGSWHGDVSSAHVTVRAVILRRAARPGNCRGKGGRGKAANIAVVVAPGVRSAAASNFSSVVHPRRIKRLMHASCRWLQGSEFCRRVLHVEVVWRVEWACSGNADSAVVVAFRICSALLSRAIVTVASIPSNSLNPSAWSS